MGVTIAYFFSSQKIPKNPNKCVKNILTVLADIRSLLKNPDVSPLMSSSRALASIGLPDFFFTTTEIKR